jgi:hypothetical protein
MFNTLWLNYTLKLDVMGFKKSKECRLCRDFASNFVEIWLTLGDIRLGTSNNCARCKLLAECTSSYQDRWRHLGQDEDEFVHIILTLPLFQIATSLLRVHLQWPSKMSDMKQLEIEIIAEVSLLGVMPH